MSTFLALNYFRACQAGEHVVKSVRERRKSSPGALAAALDQPANEGGLASVLEIVGEDAHQADGHGHRRVPAAVHERTIRFVKGLTDAALPRIVDDYWDPPVTLGVRLMSIISDDLQHAGQAAFIRGIIERR